MPKRLRTKKFNKFARKLKGRFAPIVVALVIISAGFLIERSRTMDANYTELLDTIARGESRGNYNAYFGNASNSAINFTAMSVGEVLKWQRDYVAQGNASSAVGKYQFIEPTLRGLVSELGIDESVKFDANLQDRLAIRLLERRGAQEYLHGRITREQFAHNLSKEWAALPRTIGGNPSASYYAGDGLNKSHISVREVLAAIEDLHNTA